MCLLTLGDISPNAFSKSKKFKALNSDAYNTRRASAGSSLTGTIALSRTRANKSAPEYPLVRSTMLIQSYSVNSTRAFFNECSSIAFLASPSGKGR